MRNSSSAPTGTLMPTIGFYYDTKFAQSSFCGKGLKSYDRIVAAIAAIGIRIKSLGSSDRRDRTLVMLAGDTSGCSCHTTT